MYGNWSNILYFLVERTAACGGDYASQVFGQLYEESENICFLILVS
jgi:hypothetical protein